MMRVFLGTDSEKARGAMHAAAAATKAPIIRITDTSSPEDLRAALGGGGMFAQKRVVILDRLSDNEETWPVVIDSLASMAEAEDVFVLYEEKVDATTKRLLEKHAAKVDTFDLPKKGKERPSVFALVEHMRRGDKKKLWVAYQEELARGNAPEAIHGVLFWGAKQALLAARSAKDIERGRKLIVTLTELPHESRRRGEELEYALEWFVLGVS